MRGEIVGAGSVALASRSLRISSDGRFGVHHPVRQSSHVINVTFD